MNPSTVIVSQANPQTLAPPVPVYIPTPKHILEARKANSSTAEHSEGAKKKKPKLEYVPKAISKNNSGPIPTYIPSTVRNTSIDEYEPTNPVNNDSVIPMDTDNGGANGDNVTGLLTDLLSEQITTNDQNHTKSPTKESDDNKELKEKSKENRHKSSSSSSRHRHHSSSHKSSRSDKSHSDRKSSSSRSSSSTHRSSSHHSSSSSKKSKQSDKEKEISSKEKSKHSSSKHKSSEHRSKSSSSSSSSRRHSSSSDKKTHSSNINSSNKKEDCIETDSEEDDVEAQCRMIFEEFDPSTIEIKPDDMPNNVSSPEHETNGNNEDALKKKRIAHENVNNQVRSSEQFKPKANHIRNAMQVCTHKINYIQNGKNNIHLLFLCF